MATTDRATTIRLESADLPSEDIDVFRVRGQEAISQLFHFDVDVVHRGAALNVSQLIGADACLVFERDGQDARRVYGMLSAAKRHYRRDDQEAQHYRLSLVPSAHRWSLIKTQEIYQDMSIVDIVSKKAELTDLAAQCNVAGLLGSYPKREFVVQYAETDLALISRLTEHVGVSYYFQHANGRDTITFADSPSGFGVQPEVVLHVSARADELGVTELSETTQVIPKNYIVMDYNYRTPTIDLLARVRSDHGYAGAVVEWGGHFKTVEEGTNLAQLRAEEAACHQQIFAGKSNVCEVSAGFVYPIEDHVDLDGLHVLITSITHEYDAPAAGSSGSDESPGYRNTFEATDSSRPYRPLRITPKPQIAGLLTGIVEPKENGQISANPMLDDAGRYRVKFLYDIAPLGEQKASRPVRQAQPTVGANYGMHFPLRPGIEVLLAFVNGDPDRPIIVGAVHNAQTPAHVHAANAQENVIRSASGITMRFKDQ